jgi:predicted amidophosphoribosyltransferase
VVLTVLCGPMLILLWTRETRLHWIRRACAHCGYPCKTNSSVCAECGRPLAGAAADSLPA